MRSWPRTAPCSSIVTSTPVLPEFPRREHGRLRPWAVPAHCNPGAMLAAAAVASAPAWRNVRRSVRFVSSWAILLDSSCQKLERQSPRSGSSRGMERRSAARSLTSGGPHAPNQHSNLFTQRQSMDWAAASRLLAAFASRFNVPSEGRRPHSIHGPSRNGLRDLGNAFPTPAKSRVQALSRRASGPDDWRFWPFSSSNAPSFNGLTT